VVPVDWKLLTEELAVPPSVTSEEVNPVTASEKATVTGIVVAAVVEPVVDERVTVGPPACADAICANDATPAPPAKSERPVIADAIRSFAFVIVSDNLFN